MLSISLPRRAAAIVLALALMPLALSGCGSKAPTDVYNDYVDHVMKGDWGKS